jgi:D-sedoheptulose 7-phosphate isomerase
MDAEMSDTAMDIILGYLVQSWDAVQAAIEDPAFCRAIRDIAEVTAVALRKGSKLLLAANGGSAGDAQHIAGEMLSRLNYDRAPAAALALTTDSSVRTAVANDYGYERVLERQILGLGCPGDVLIAISTSGRSPNILRAISAGREKQLTIVGFTGKTGGEMAMHCNLCLHAPSDSTPLIQQIHITARHIICGLVEENLFPQANSPQ